MRILCFLLTLSGCVSKHSPKIYHTELKPENRNWVKVYAHELKVAIENNDGEAYYFFWPEYLKEYDKQRYKAGVNKN